MKRKASIDLNCIKNACRKRMVVVTGSEPAPADTTAKPCCQHKTKNCCRKHMVLVPGYGQREYPFPSVDEVVKKGCESVLEQLQRVAGKAHGRGDGSEGGQVALARKGIRSEHKPGQGSKPHTRKSVQPAEPAPTGGAAGPAIFAAAEGLRQVFYNGRFDAIVADKFDPLTGAVNWASTHMAAKYQPAVTSLQGHLDKLQELYREALPKIMDFLAAQFPDASKEELLEAAVQVLDEQLAEILYVLRIWTDAFGQLRDGEYKQLEAVVNTVEQAFHLFRTGDITGACDDECQKRLKSRVFGIGDVFVARFSKHGPATIPGSRGPVGAHAIEVPHDERKIITLMLVLYLHEFRHDIFADVEGLDEEMTAAVVEAIQKANAEGKFKFSTDKVKIGRGAVSMADLLTKIMVDTLGENDADICGGVLLSGPAFLYNMLATFSAFNAKESGVFGQESLLRSESVYEVDKDGGLNFEVHLPDYIRAFLVASALDLLGFKAEADECRVMADQAVGQPLPKDISWEDAEGKRKLVIKVPVSDLKQVLPVVAEAIIKTPLKSLGGVSADSIVNWTRRRQDKVNSLVENLMAGKADVPTDKGDFFATYVAAAATLAYWALVKKGTHPLKATPLVEANALKMLETVKERLESKAQAAPERPASDPKPAPEAPDKGSK